MSMISRSFISSSCDTTNQPKNKQTETKQRSTKVNTIFYIAISIENVILSRILVNVT